LSYGRSSQEYDSFRPTMQGLISSNLRSTLFALLAFTREKPNRITKAILGKSTLHK
jgi:hypothetical protein